MTGPMTERLVKALHLRQHWRVEARSRPSERPPRPGLPQQPERH
ncbi:hypothetical protein [Streptomyces sp. TRM49041]|nr:hypothetical protein [Streptomyces sp. TRM49041]